MYSTLVLHTEDCSAITNAFPGCQWVLWPLLFIFHLLLSNSWQMLLHPHLSAVKGEGWCAHKPAWLELPDLTQVLAASFCRGHLLLFGSVTRPRCAQLHSCHIECSKQLGFCQVRTHSQTERSSQDKACPGKTLFLFWHCSLEQEGIDPRTVTAGVWLWRRFKTQT